VEIDLSVCAPTHWETSPPYPELKAVKASISHVRMIALQEITVEASEPESAIGGQILVQRLVAQLENNQEIELMRSAAPVTGEEAHIEDGICKACGVPFADESQIEIYEGEQYHKTCMS
jgi:hypothetical protein